MLRMRGSYSICYFIWLNIVSLSVHKSESALVICFRAVVKRGQCSGASPPNLVADAIDCCSKGYQGYATNIQRFVGGNYGCIQCSGDADVNWSDWSAWSFCSTSCGQGQRSRTRKCHTPRGWVSNLSACGSWVRQQEDCDVPRACPDHGGWSDWMGWSRCPGSCGQSTRQRTRSCNSPVPSFGGRGCVGAELDSDNCLNVQCPVNGQWSAWSPWTACSRSCNSGIQVRNRLCSNPVSKYGGLICPGGEREQRTCETQRKCQVNGGWSAWMSTTSCSSIDCTNDVGYLLKYRSCTYPRRRYGGKTCTGSRGRAEQCNTMHDNCRENGGWCEWDSPNVEFDEKTGKMPPVVRTRLCECPSPFNKGLRCPGSEQDSIPFINKTTIHWMEWSAWSNCSQTCGEGNQTRTRLCTREGPNSAKECSKAGKQSKICKPLECPEENMWTDWAAWLECSMTSGNSTRRRRRWRKINISKAWESTGQKHYEEEKIVCENRILVLDGNWGGWSSWNQCSQSCDHGGRMYRRRQCNDPVPAKNGQDCVGSADEISTCLTGQCPVAGGWSRWGQWSKCSVTCEGGAHTRTRQCDNPRPRSGGEFCHGKEWDYKMCIVAVGCPVNGGWNKWIQTQPCNAMKCDENGGYIHYARLCNNPSPKYNGRDCTGKRDDWRPCQRMDGNCPVNGEWCEWEDLSQCSQTCNLNSEERAVKRRQRECSCPRPKNNGKMCDGADNHGIMIENQPCYEVPLCPGEVVCGHPSLAQPGQSENVLRISHRTKTSKGAHPWFAHVWVTIEKKTYVCGGTLLNNEWVLTAAHCVAGAKLTRSRVILGTDSCLGQGGVHTHIQDIVIHDGYSFNKYNYDNDIALVKLSIPVSYSETVSPICLADEDFLLSKLVELDGRHRAHVSGESKPPLGIVSGCGSLSDQEGPPSWLREVQLPLAKQQICTTLIDRIVTGNMFCAGSTRNNTGVACKGDSGGPFIMKTAPGHYVLVGIVSWGHGCDHVNRVGYYVRVGNYKDWILAIMEAK